MASLMCHLHFWSLKNFTPGTGSDVGTHVYHEKAAVAESSYAEYRRQWAESRSVTWTPKNRRPEKLRDQLRECEDMVQSFKVIHVKWKNLRNCQLLLSNGALLSFLVASNSGDIEKIFLDKSLVGKIPDPIFHAIVTENFLVFSFLEKSKLFYIYLNKKQSIDFKKLEKLSALEPKISYVDLVGLTSKRIARNLSVNSRQDMVVCWWSAESDEAWPWSPMTTEKDKANLILFGVNGIKLETLCYVRTECDPICVSFSYNQGHHVHTLEKSTMQPGAEANIDSCIYEYTRNKIERVAVTPIPTKAAIVVQQRNHTEDKLLLGCEDGTVMMYDDNRRVAHMTKTTLIPSCIQWHPTDVVVLVCSEKGEIQVFDMALAPVLIQLASESPSPRRVLELLTYFSSPVTLDSVSWSSDAPIANIEGNVSCHDDLLVVFSRGPLCLLRLELGVLTHGRFGTVELVSEYIRHEQAEQAVNLLNSMNWNTEGNASFACLVLIMNYLLRLPLNHEREGLLEDALGSFYAPSRTLSDVTVLQFRDPISKVSRRFFHHLLRYKRFDKAFLLAVDINAKELFMDIHYLAADVGNFGLAEVAKQKAFQINNEPLTSDESYGDDDASYEDEEAPEGEEGGEHRVHYHDNEYNGSYSPTLPPQSLMPLEEEDGILELQGAQQIPYPDDTDGQCQSIEGAPLGSEGTLKIVHFGVV